MFAFGQMHGLTVIFILLELMMFSVQLYFYLIWPCDKRRFNYLILLVLLILYNVAGGLFPDQNIHFISFQTQTILAYGAGFIMAAYFPYYFYSSFELRALRFHALYGTSLLILLPYVVFFVLIYPLTNDLDFALGYGMIVPGLYSPILLYAMFNAINLRFLNIDKYTDQYTKLEMKSVYWAVSPWVFMALFSVLQVKQWIEVLFTNTGFVVIAFLFLKRSARLGRMEKQRLKELEEMDEKNKTDFREVCLSVGLSEREIEVALMLCQGMTYKGIGEALFISSRTVDTYVQRIFYKTEVNSKIELQRRLGWQN